MAGDLHCTRCGAVIEDEGLLDACLDCLLVEGLDPGPPDAAKEGASPEGTPFGEYDLLGELARGGMGVVYKARHRALGRVVALKMILAGDFAGPEAIQRFRTETGVVASLRHPNIVALHEVGDVDGLRYYTMDYVEGPDLARTCREGPVQPRRAARILCAVARAMASAHARGIVHRDLKPSNILLDADDEPRITDFGLAKHLSSDADLTRTGQALGSPGYMPPEQCDSRRGEVGPAADVYAMGAILHEMLTGRPPFVAGTVAETLQLVLNADPIAPRELNPTVPEDLEAIALKCLEKEPARRYAGARELADDLDRWMENRPVRARRLGLGGRLARWCRREPRMAGMVAAVSVVVVAAAVGAVVSALRIAEARDAEERERRRAERNVSDLRLKQAEDWIEEGRALEALALLARILRAEPTNALASRRLASLLTFRSFGLPLYPAVAVGSPLVRAVWEPGGGRFLTVAADGRIEAWESGTGRRAGPFLDVGGPPVDVRYVGNADRVLVAGPGDNFELRDRDLGPVPVATARFPEPIRSVAADAAGRRFFVVAGASYYCWDAERGAMVAGPLRHGSIPTAVGIDATGRLGMSGGQDGMVVIWNLPAGTQSMRLGIGAPVTAAVLDPGGKRVAAGAADGRIRMWTLWDGAEEWTTRTRGPVTVLAFSPSGTWLAAGTADGKAWAWDCRDLSVQPRELRHRTSVVDARFEGGEDLLVTRCSDGTAWLWDVAGGRVRVEPEEPAGSINDVRVNPAGTRWVTVTDDGTLQESDVRAGTETGRAFAQGGDFPGAFDRDGRQVLTASPAGEVRLWNADDGTPDGEPVRVGEGRVGAQLSADDSRLLAWSEDGVANVRDQGTGASAWSISEGTESFRLAAMSPDGAALATAGYYGSVWHHALPGGRGRLLESPAEANVTAIVFAGPSGAVFLGDMEGGLSRWDAGTRVSVRVASAHRGAIVALAAGPDGLRVASASRDRTARLWDAASARAVGEPMRHSGEVRFVAFSRDGTLVATGSDDGTAGVWSAATGLRRVPPLEHRGAVTGVAFSPDGTMVATAGQDRTVRIWSTATGQPVGEAIPGPGPFTGVHWQPDGRRLLAGESGGPLWLWDLPPLEVPPPWLADVAEALSGRHGIAGPSGSDAFVALRGRGAGGGGGTGWDRWLRWFLADRGARDPSWRAGTEDGRVRVGETSGL